MNCTDYEYKFMRSICHFPHDTLQAYEFYQMIYADIPIINRLNILLNVIYAEFKVDESITKLIEKCLSDETKDIRQQRIINTRLLLKDYINEDETITVYRGINENNRGVDGLSWSLDKDIGLRFATNGSSHGSIITGKIFLPDILAINNLIDEAEVISLPMNIYILSVEPVEHNADLFKRLKERSIIFDEKLTAFALEKERAYEQGN